MEDVQAAGTGFSGGGSARTGRSPKKSDWRDIVYDELDDYHRSAAEHALGLHGRSVPSNQDVAAKLSRSPGAISQAEARTQKVPDGEYESSPFGG